MSRLCLVLNTPHKDTTALTSYGFVPLLLQCRIPYAAVHTLVLLMMGIMMPETCWDKYLIINIGLVASCWFLSLHPKKLHVSAYSGHHQVFIRKSISVHKIHAAVQRWWDLIVCGFDYYYYYTHNGDGTFQNFVRYLYLTLHMLCCFCSSYIVSFVLFLSCASKCFSVIGIAVTCWISPPNIIQRLLKVQELHTARIEHRQNRLTDRVNSISRSSCFYWTCGTCCTYVLLCSSSVKTGGVTDVMQGS